MKAAIVIGTYNNEAHIVQTIASVKSQKMGDWRCLVIDNGSTDASSEIAQKETFQDDR
ncbi:glycosyltransferase family 2 protein, partial [Rhodopirellula sallentina]